jgi:hypothetical protein
MPSGNNRSQCEEYARDCVRLAQNPIATPELREHLLAIARNWMQVSMDEKEKSPTHNTGANK